MQKARLILTLVMMLGLLTASIFLVGYFNISMDDIPTVHEDGTVIEEKIRQQLLNKKRTAHIIGIVAGFAAALIAGNRLKKFQKAGE